MRKSYRDAALNVKTSSYEAIGTIEVETGTIYQFSGPAELPNREVVRLQGISIDVEPLILLSRADVKVDTFEFMCVDTSFDRLSLGNGSGLTKSEIIGVGDFRPRDSLCTQRRRERSSIVCDIGDAIDQVSSRIYLAILNTGYLHISLPLILGPTSIVVSYKHEFSVVRVVDITPLLFSVLESICGIENQIQHSFIILAIHSNIELLELLERDDRKTVLGVECQVGKDELAII